MPVKAPIYKDTYYSASTAVMPYTIEVENRTIYAGKAYRMPNETALRININKICQDYLSQELDTNWGTGSSTSQTNHNACLDFTLKNASGTTLETYRFLYDWDYGHSWTGQSATLSEAINGHYVSGQWRLSTSVTTGGTVSTKRNDNNLYTKEVCGDYVLHFVGARGGWMSFCFEGRCTKTDNITQHFFNRAFDNNTTEFEQGKYISEITTSYKLHTGILSEEEAASFAKNLISSNKAYLQIVSQGKIIPVVITDTQAEYKQEGQEDVITYEVNIKESQTKIKK